MLHALLPQNLYEKALNKKSRRELPPASEKNGSVVLRAFGTEGGLLLLHQLEKHGAEQQDGDKVGNGHERVAGIGQQPYQIELDEYAHGNGDAVHHTEGKLRPVTEEVYGAAFAVHAPAHGGGEGEEGKAHRHHDAAYAGQHAFKGGGSDGRAFLTVAPQARYQQGEGREAAYHDGVDEGVEHTDGGLRHGGTGGSRGMSHGGRAETGFVGEDAARHAHADGHHDGSARRAALGRRGSEGLAQNHGENAGHFAYMHDDDQQRHGRIAKGHDGHDLARHGGDALHPAEQHQTGKQQKNHGGNFKGNAEARLQHAAYGVALHHGARAYAGHDAEKRKRASQPHPAAPQAVFNEEHGSAHPVACRGTFPEVHGKQHFAELGGHTHKGRHPHPEQRAGAAHVNGRGHAHDVAGAYVAGKGRHERIEGRNLPVLRILPASGPGMVQPPGEVAYGEETQPDGEIQAGAEKEHQHAGAPDEVVDEREPFHDAIPL